MSYEIINIMSERDVTAQSVQNLKTFGYEPTENQSFYQVLFKANIFGQAQMVQKILTGEELDKMKKNMKYDE